jgi:D-glycero-D-manno-heptose 1,7-bisphosphate phosphatase
MKGLFLDRDGVINVDHGYVHTTDQLELIPQTLELIGHANQKHIPVIVITNQSGIARGYYTEHEHSLFVSFIKSCLFSRGVFIQDYLYSPFLPNAPVSSYSKPDSEYRKPSPGLIEYAISIYSLDAPSSIFIGDNESDMEAALSAHIGLPLLLTSNKLSSKYNCIRSPLEAISYL